MHSSTQMDMYFLCKKVSNQSGSCETSKQQLFRLFASSLHPFFTFSFLNSMINLHNDAFSCLDIIRRVHLGLIFICLSYVFVNFIP